MAFRLFARGFGILGGSVCVTTCIFTAFRGHPPWGSPIIEAEGPEKTKNKNKKNNKNIILSPFSQKNWQSFELIDISPLNHNTSIFHFKYPDSYKHNKMNLPIASCITAKFYDKTREKDVIRPYTPITKHIKKTTKKKIPKLFAN